MPDKLKILVTGAKGFVGKNLCAQLNAIRDGKDRRFPGLIIEEVMEYDIDSTLEQLEEYCAKADFVFNLAGVNRPENPDDFRRGNFGFASTLLDTLKKHGNCCPVMLSSSIQATLIGRYAGHPYGESKKAGEELFFGYANETGAKVLVYRFPNLFGKWCRPNYNSAVATFCNNIANGLPIQVNDPSVELELLYIDDLVDEMIAALQGNEHRCNYNGITPSPCGEGQGGAEGRYCYVPHTHKATLGQIVSLLEQFKAQPQTLVIPEIPKGSFAKALYSTYLSYLPKEKVAFPLKMNVDARGSFTELVKSANVGQVSINISKPGITKGEHWHNTKWEQFIVVKGHGLILQRSLAAPLNPPSRGTARDTTPYHTANPLNYELLKENAKRMRKVPSDGESAMWEILCNPELACKFRRQHVIGDYIVDFVDLSKRLVIEIDGTYHNTPEQQTADALRSQYLSKQDFLVLRFTNEDVLFKPEHTSSVVKNLLKYLPLEGEVRGAVVSGSRIEAVHMLPGYTHNIINLSDTDDLVTVMYCNECFDPNHPDTFFERVL